jgi:LuxR family maltose regulon positive regulatory protein
MRGNTLSLAKITLPRISAFLPRERLFRALDEKRKRPLVWISGPAGSGKTTLVASYLQARELPCIWYRMDEGDGDFATFFYYMGLAGKKAAPRIRNPLPLLTPEYLQGGVPIFALRFFENLFGRLKQSFLLVLDNYDSVSDEPQFHEVIGNVFSTTPEGINVLVISRKAFPRALTRLHANGDMALLGWNDLRLTIEETAGIVSLRRLEIRPEDMRQLHRDADGWIAGLVLMLESMKAQISPRYSGGLSRDEIIDYFGTQFFARLDKELQDFLLKTAFLPRITVGMAEKLTGLPHSANILSRLARNSYFTERDHSPEPVYRYHQLLKEFLAARARAEMPPLVLAALLAKTARLLEVSGDIEDAAELFIQTADWDNLARLVLAQAPALLSQGRYGVLQEWLAAMPPEKVNASPWLLYWNSMCLMAQAPVQSTDCFEKAFRLFEAQKDEAGMLLAWSGAVDSILLGWENFTSLTSWFGWLENRLHDHPRFPSSEIEARVAASVVGIFAWALPASPDVRDWLERALPLLPAIGDDSLQVQALSNSVTYFFWLGDIGNMRPLVDRAKAMALSDSATPVSLIAWKITEMRTKLLMPDELESVLDLAGEVIELAEKNNIHIQDNLVYGMAASAALSMNDTALAEKFLRKMEAIAPRIPRAMTNVTQYIAGWLNFLGGNFHYALAHAEKGLQVSLECATPIPEILIRQLIARIHYAKGNRDAALLEVSTTKEIIAKMGNSPLFTYFSLLDEAHFLFDAGEEKKAVEVLRSALRIGMEHQYKTLALYWQAAPLARLCAKALEYDIETPYVQDLVRSLHLVPDTRPLEIDRWPWAIKIYTLGRFELQRNGEPIEFSRKAQKKPLDVLKALLALGGKGVKEEAITDIVWPEAAGDAAHHSFEVNLQRLRALLGYPQALQLRDGRLTLDDRHCWVDLWVFERFLDRVKHEGDSNRALHAAEKGMELYAGHFLAGEIDEPWILSLRERLRTKFLGNVRWLGRRYGQAGRWQDAMDCYQRGLEVDNLAEEIYRRLMACHLHLGQRGEALSLYIRCKQTLSLILGITPSPETERLHKMIRDNFKTSSDL